jgi:L-lactate dehydrogenase complex protein LldF
MPTEVAELITKFKSEAGKAGFIIYESASADDIRGYILKLAWEREVRTAVKSKSKLAGKIKLRLGLEKAGIAVTETDIEEWLAQLAGGKATSRINITQARTLISKATGQKLDAEPSMLLNAVNKVIRQYCIDADLGISEADIAIAETGTLVLTGNEGVGRLVAVLPRIHVTLLDPQNIVPMMEDVFSKLKKVVNPGARQMVPGYVTYITGRNTTADIPGAVLARAQGPAEEHVILVNETIGRRKA